MCESCQEILVVSGPPAPQSSDAARGASRYDAAFEVAALYDRLRALETRPSRSASPWYDSDILKTVVSGIILAAFGFFLTGRLEQSTKERELSTRNATDMQGPLLKLRTGNSQEAQAAAMSLTTYGQYAIPPLVESLQASPESATAAENGLKALALTDAEGVCTTLARVLANRTQRYDAQTHSAVIRVLGEADCQSSVPALKEYATRVARADADTSALAAYQREVRGVSQSNVTQMKRDLANTFQLLHVDRAP
jgi:hypothetical protein